MNTSGKITQLNAGHLDFEKVLELDQNQFPRPWSSKDWQSLNWDHHHLFGWELDGSLVGFALFGHVLQDDSSHLLKICIQVNFQGRGISQVFWGSCLKNLKLIGVKSIYLEVEASNHRAIGFYKKMSFKSLRKIKAYYSDGSDAETMEMTF